ncbi:MULTISPECIES: hypothetical protein [unclassified Mycobacterium]|uniref:hypothetical protein n=1 Tax=unclassified Mycobacterium TaxID=2642494 RepID=UPI0029C781BB|nr:MULTISPECIES: hypothetical protein [unclassified Mycobacterium]
MVVPARRSPNNGVRAPRLSRVAVVAVGVGIAAAAGHDVAWADTGHSDSSGNTSTHSKSGTSSGPRKAQGGHRHQRDRSSTTPKSPDADSAAETAKPSEHESNSQPSQHDSTPRAAKRIRLFDTAGAGTTKTGSSPHLAVNDQAHLRIFARAADRQTTVKPTARPAEVAALISSKSESAPSTSATDPTTTPSDPEPLSPIAKIAALPGRIVNTVLQTLDITVSSTGPKSPLNFAPIDEALFAAFRRVEAAVGLDKTPVAQPVPPAETYDGSTTAKTPTVAQFLNAAASEYVLGGTPDGLQPFTVDGKQMTSTNVLTGESAQVWVTPQKQVIIAYQGTTGGTNLLFNPLIAISQVVTDAQVIFTDTTPQAFTDSLTFEQQVEAAAAEQGYDKSDIFVTGHSLGGWEAEYVAQQAGVGGIGFESPGINTIVEGNGVDSGFVNVETYGDTAAYLATDLPALQPFMPAYVPAGGSKPHYGSIVMLGDPDATNPLVNASSLWGTSLVGDAIFAVDILGNFLEHHLPGMQAYNLGVSPDPGVVPWLGATMGPIEAGYGDMTIPQLELAASQAGTLIKP